MKTKTKTNALKEKLAQQEQAMLYQIGIIAQDQAAASQLHQNQKSNVSK